MTLIWFVIWLVSDRIGDREALLFDPVNLWVITLIAAVAVDLSRPHVFTKAKGD
jgi:hypothetical protein